MIRETAIVSPDGKIRARDLPNQLHEASPVAGEQPAGGPPVTFREAKGQVVDG